jgi:hypothetical protein
MFDPTLPQPGTEIDADQMRDQLNGLKDLIDAISTITSAQVDGVSTVNPGEAASVSLSVVGNTLHFTFGIPRGQDGPAGPVFGNTVVDGVTTLNPGEAATVQTSFDGSNVRFQFGIPRGSDGMQGPQGPVFTNFVIDGVTTLQPTDPATVNLSFDGSAVRLLFGIPRGNDGGPGPPGEVTNVQLATAIHGTSSNSNAVATMDALFANDPPTLADLELMQAKMNELINALRR